MIWAGLALGFLGSLHCVGMCGPIALTAFSKSGSISVWPRLLYNLGRTLTYSFMGLAVGIAGQIIELSGFQQYASILLGSILLIFVILYFAGIKSYPVFESFVTRIKRGLGKILRSEGGMNRFALGLINGFLPCGLVYLALAGALMGENVQETVLYMAAFGLGTIPAMWAISYIAPGISRFIDINRLVPYMFAIIGILLILRGLGLGIPFISPGLGEGTGHDHPM